MAEDLDALEEQVDQHLEAVEEDLGEIADRVRHSEPVETFISGRWKRRPQMILAAAGIFLVLVLLLRRRRR